MTTDKKIDKMIEVLQAFKEGKQIQVKGNSSHEWHDTKSPYWNFVFCEFRIKPEKVCIPATQEELEDINSVIFIKDKKDKDIYSLMGSEAEIMGFKNKTIWYKLNPNTKCWEDWSEE